MKSFPRRIAALSLTLAAASASAQSNDAITVEIVDDTGFAHSPYILLVGKEVTLEPPPSGVNPATAVQNGSQTAATTISQLPDAGYTIDSMFSGRTGLPVYAFTVSDIESGNIYFFKNDGSGTPPFTYEDGTSPSPDKQNSRYDVMEFTYGPTIQSCADLTSIDMLGMQFQLELFHEGIEVDGDAKPDDLRTYYASTESLLRAIHNLKPSAMNETFFKMGESEPEPGWDFSDGLDTFIRAKGPVQFAESGPAFSPAPYTSFRAYLASLTEAGGGEKLEFRVSGNGETPTDGATNDQGDPIPSTYDYVFEICDDDNGGFKAVSVPGKSTTTNTAKNANGVSVPENASVTIHLPDARGAEASVTMSPSGAWMGSSSPPIPAVQVVSNGSDLKTPPVINIPAPDVEGGTKPTIEVNIAGGGLANFPDSDPASPFKITDPGSGYTSAFEITVESEDGTTDAVGKCFIDSSVESITVTKGGAGYFGSKLNEPGFATIVQPDGVPVATTNPATIKRVENNDRGEITQIELDDAGAGYLDAPTIHVVLPPGGFDFNIYGAPLSSAVVKVDGLSNTDFDGDTNVVYGAMTRDVLAALNFGYIGGVYGNNASNWFAPTPTAFPFGLARDHEPKTNDGYYNPWAAIFYRYSDAYSFAFSDKAGPNPLMSLSPGDTVRITLLPDQRLDSPQPFVKSATEDTLEIEWQEVPGATGYEAQIVVPQGFDKVAINDPKTVEHTFSGLNPATPYTIAVVALGEGIRRSPAQPMRAITPGSQPPASTGDDTLVMNFTWASETIPPGVDQDNLAFFVDQTKIPYNVNPQNTNIPVTVAGTQGTLPSNQLVFRVVENPGEENEQLLFSDILSLDLYGSITELNVGEAKLFGSEGPVSLAAGSDGGPPYNGNGTFRAGVTFIGEPTKRFANVIIPGRSYNQWVTLFAGFFEDLPFDNPDGDPFGNRLEYFFGGNPTISDLAGFPAAAYVEDEIILTYPVAKDIRNIAEQIEISFNLEEWFGVDPEFLPDADLGETFLRTARIPFPPGANEVFVRVTVD